MYISPYGVDFWYHKPWIFFLHKKANLYVERSGDVSFKQNQWALFCKKKQFKTASYYLELKLIFRQPYTMFNEYVRYFKFWASTRVQIYLKATLLYKVQFGFDGIRIFLKQTAFFCAKF